jgi:hypothetical protein
MKTLINTLIILTVLTSCRIQKYNDGYKEEMEYYKLHPIVEKEKTPCINKMYCDKSLFKNDDRYFEKNVFLIGDLNSDFKYYLCLEQNSTYEIDTNTEFVIDTLQYHCPIN